MRPARYVPSVAIFAGNQDHIGLDVSPIAASTPSPIFSWRCSRFHERSGNELSAGVAQSNQNKNVHSIVDNILTPRFRFVVKRPLTAAIHNRWSGSGELMFTHRSLVGWIKGLRYAVRLNDFKLAQRLRMALTATLRHIDEPVRDEVARLVDISGLRVRNIGDRHKRKREIDRLAGEIGRASCRERVCLAV